MNGDTQVLIVGAGPTGLALALWLMKLGVRFRLIERNGGPGEGSRAMVVHARTLEFYRQLGFAEEMVRHGIPIDTLNLCAGERHIATFPFGDFGQGLSRYPFMLSLPQDDHERLLVEQLTAAGGEVEWNTELLGFIDGKHGVRASVRGPEGEETLAATFLCGCDGAHSTVRQTLQLDFPGGEYQHRFYVADVRAHGTVAAPGFAMHLGKMGFCAVFPIRSSGTQRLIGIIPDSLEALPTLSFDDLQPLVEQMVGIQVDQVNWFSSYRVHHRVAEHFRRGNVFLSGDAGHIHSPVGGQGMNTGIGDAVNLAWKLADVLQGRADPRLLDSYEIERIAFARTLVASTDRLFKAIVNQGLLGRLTRGWIVPRLLPVALGFTLMRRQLFRTVSQTRIHYRHSPLSEGHAGRVHGGDRLPWVDGGGNDNYEPLRGIEWQIHVYGELDVLLRNTALGMGITALEFEWSETVAEAGFRRDAFYLIRPDGYVALASATQNVERLRRFLEK